MKKDQTLYYLLFMLLIMGAFASMAQNSYGLVILGGVAAVFGLSFGIELIGLLGKKKPADPFVITELVCLLVLAVLLALRVFYIHFRYVEVIFVIAGLLLAIVYFRKMLNRYKIVRPVNHSLAILVLVFHASIILFLVSLVSVPFVPIISQSAGIIAFMLLLVFVATGFFSQDKIVEGETKSVFGTVTQLKDHSVLILTLFLLFSLYVGGNKIGLLPAIYSDEFPQAYFDRVEQAASGKEVPVNGKYQHELFKERYDAFVQRNK